MPDANKSADRTKFRAAMSSLVAAIALTGFKIVVGVLTGSLGILAEAAHSGLDLVAALVTVFAIRMSSKPADEDHNYGHGKVETLSALFETGLLLATCFWIVREAVKRLAAGSAEVEVNVWSFLVISARSLSFTSTSPFGRLHGQTKVPGLLHCAFFPTR